MNRLNCFQPFVTKFSLQFFFILITLHFQVSLFTCSEEDITKTLYAAEGSTVVIKCQIYQEVEIIDNKVNHMNSSMLYFTYGSVNVTNVVRNKKIASIKIPNAQISNSGNYYCYLNLPGFEPTLMKIFKLKVGKPPAYQKPNEFNCQSDYFKTLKCMWKVNHPLTSTTHSLVVNFLFKNKTFYNYSCKILSINNAACAWNKSFAQMFKKNFTQLLFHLKTTNLFGSLSQNFSIDYYSIVNPGRVENLSFLKINSTKVFIKWDYPLIISNDKDLEKLMIFKVSYLIHAQRGEEIDVGVTSQLKFVITGLKPQKKYCVIIRSRFKARKDWNVPPLLENFKTLAEVPFEPPKTIPGAFELRSINKYRRNLRIYWKPISKENYNGEKFEYRGFLYFGQKSEEFVVAKENHTCDFYNLPANFTYSVKLYSSNEIGTSHNYSNFHIEPLNDISIDLIAVFATNNQNGTYHIYWTTYIYQNISYTIFYCQVRKYKLTCKTSIEILPIDNINQTMIEMQLDNDERYKFGISANSGQKSTGILWSHCDDLSDFNDQHNYFKEFHLESVDEETVEVRWELKCQSLELFISKFLIEYCPSAQEGICKKNMISTINVKNYIRKLRIENLERDTTYIFSVDAITKTGQVLTSPSAGIKTPIGAFFFSLILLLLITIILITMVVVHFGKQKWNQEKIICQKVKEEWNVIKMPFLSCPQELFKENLAFKQSKEKLDSSFFLDKFETNERVYQSKNQIFGSSKNLDDCLYNLVHVDVNRIDFEKSKRPDVKDKNVNFLKETNSKNELFKNNYFRVGQANDLTLAKNDFNINCSNNQEQKIDLKKEYQHLFFQNYLGNINNLKRNNSFLQKLGSGVYTISSPDIIDSQYIINIPNFYQRSIDYLIDDHTEKSSYICFS